MELAHRKAHDAHGTLKEAAAAYIEAQFELVFAARAAHDHGVAVTELHTSWLSVAAEQAVVEAQIETAQEEAQWRQVDDAVGKVLDALRAAGYEPALRIEDVRYEGGGPSPPGPRTAGRHVTTNPGRREKTRRSNAAAYTNALRMPASVGPPCCPAQILHTEAPTVGGEWRS